MKVYNIKHNNKSKWSQIFDWFRVSAAYIHRINSLQLTCDISKIAPITTIASNEIRQT